MRQYAIILIIIFCIGHSYATRYALLVGNSKGGNEYGTLKYVKNDINEVRKVFSQFCGFKDDNILSLFNSTPQELEKVLARLKAHYLKSPDTDMFVFYYSGHADAKNLLMGNTVYPLAKLKQQFKDLSTKMRIAIFDACQSGSFTRIKGGTLKAPFLFREGSKIKGQVVLYSSSSNEYSQESDLYKNSIFTFHFVNALRGSGDASGDRKITLSEAYQYSYNQTVSSTIHSASGVQHPGYQFKIQGEGNVILADVNIRSSGILLPKAISGTVIVLNRDRTIVTELEKEEQSELVIALNPGVYEVINNREGNIYKMIARVNNKTLSVIDSKKLKKIKSMPAYSKGGTKRLINVGVVLSGSFCNFDLHRLRQQSNDYFNNYQHFNINPEFKFPNNRIKPGLGVEVKLKKIIHLFQTLEYLRTTNDYTYNSLHGSPGDQNQYASSLVINDTLSVFGVRTGIGYSPPYGIMRYTCVKAGLDILYVTRTVSSTLTDELYDIQATNNGVDFGYLRVPFIGLDIQYPVNRFLDVGAQILYRYQSGSKDLKESFISGEDKNSADYTFRYNFTGINAGLFVRFMLNRL